MGPKKASASGGSGEKRKKVSLALEIKQEIIAKHERGVHVSDLAKQYGRNMSTILKQKDAIKAVKPSKGITKRILGYHQQVVDFVEKHHPQKLQVCRAASQFDTICLTHFRNILKSRTKQTSLDQFFKKAIKRSSSYRDEESESEAKKSKPKVSESKEAEGESKEAEGEN